MLTLGVIPARFDSTRFPGKPLVQILGKSMIRRVYEQVLQAKSIDKVVVATDDERILNEISSFGGNAIMTSKDHLSGTDRCYEALTLLDETYDVVVNIQGDEPFIHPQQINQVAELLQNSTFEIATLARKIHEPNDLFNPNIVKVIFDKWGKAIYFSRHPIPYVRGVEEAKWTHHYDFYKHIGLYAYRKEVLAAITQLSPSSLEKSESLEQLRWVENGYSIALGITDKDNFGIDSPSDIENLANLLKNSP